MTIRAIARELGVSCAAVSLGLRNSGRVSADLRKRILQAAKAAGYTPNARVAELMSEIRKTHHPDYRATLGAFSLYPAEHPWEERPYLKEMLDAAIGTAASHGYRLDYFWLKRPGMSVRRFCSILRTRGINGLLCLGSPDPAEKMSALLRRVAIVTQGPSIRDTLHRVLSNSFADASRVIGELIRRGYRRPGMVLLQSGDERNRYSYSSSLLGFQERGLTAAPAIPILRSEIWDANPFGTWFDTHQPDVIVLHQSVAYIDQLEQYLEQQRIKVPADLGIALLNSGSAGHESYSGVFQDNSLHGATAIEMLIGRVHLRDYSRPKVPKLELLDSSWREGNSLRRAATAKESTRNR